MDLSYNNPMAALPRNQAMPKPVSNTPNAVLRFSAGTTLARTAFSNETCAPIPIPHSTIPMRASVNPPERQKARTTQKAKLPEAELANRVCLASGRRRGSSAPRLPWRPHTRPESYFGQQSQSSGNERRPGQISETCSDQGAGNNIEPVTFGESLRLQRPRGFLL
jgi:hypothetical protein